MLNTIILRLKYFIIIRTAFLATLITIVLIAALWNFNEKSLLLEFCIDLSANENHSTLNHVTNTGPLRSKTNSERIKGVRFSLTKQSCLWWILCIISLMSSYTQLEHKQMCASKWKVYITFTFAYRRTQTNTSWSREIFVAVMYVPLVCTCTISYFVFKKHFLSWN